MYDDYQIPAIALVAALMLAFGYLHSRFRSVRTLLWMLALGCAELQEVLRWAALHRNSFPHTNLLPSALAFTAGSESALLLSSVLFLASLSSLSFHIGRRRVLYAVPYLLPLLGYSILFYATHQLPSNQNPPPHLLWVFCLLAFAAFTVALVWSSHRGPVPYWVGGTLVSAGGLICIPFFLQGNVYGPLLVNESGNLVMAALLVVYSYRRLSPGVFLATAGFLAWSLPLLLALQPLDLFGFARILLFSAVTLGKVVVAVGLILLVLEDEVQKNQAARERERSVRLELEAYARQALTARSLEDFDRDTSQLCSMIVEQSRFRTVAMIVRSSTGSYGVVGYSGMDGATAGALDALAERLPPSTFSPATSGGFNEAGTPALVPDSTSLDLNLAPWLTPGDDLERLHLTRVGVVPMLGPDNTVEGALLLADPSEPLESLRADDLLPLEILAGRLQSARAQSLMLGKLIESERFAGVGQLANNVAQQLNNPLTVILGYSTLLEESSPVGPDRRGAEAIVVEARRMKSILERLARFSQLANERYTSFSVADLVSDIEQMHRTDFLRHSIEFRLTITPDLPPIFGNIHQVRQALLHAVQFSIESVLRAGSNDHRAIRMEASSAPESEGVQIVIGHSGQGFPHPDRAFDSLSSGFSNSESTGIGLSLTAAIVREHRGSIKAVNYQPAGAAVVLDLPVS